MDKKIYMDEHDRLTAHITRTEAIAKTVEINFLDGCEGYHSINEERVASLLWQIEENLHHIKESADRLYDGWRKVAIPELAKKQAA